MTRWTLAGSMALAALGVAVLDIGSSTAEAATSVSPFAGSYIGADPQGWNGSWAVTISDGGLITGSFTEYKNSILSRGSITGQVSANGSYSLKVYVSRYLGGERHMPPKSYQSAGKMAGGHGQKILGTTDTGTSFVWRRK